MAKGFGEASLKSKKRSKSSLIMPSVDCEQIQKQWAEHFEDLTDPRGSQGVLHPFISIVMIALLATIGGAKGWEDIEIYGVSKARRASMDKNYLLKVLAASIPFHSNPFDG